MGWTREGNARGITSPQRSTYTSGRPQCPLGRTCTAIPASRRQPPCFQSPICTMRCRSMRIHRTHTVPDTGCRILRRWPYARRPCRAVPRRWHTANDLPTSHLRRMRGRSGPRWWSHAEQKHALRKHQMRTFGYDQRNPQLSRAISCEHTRDPRRRQQLTGSALQGVANAGPGIALCKLDGIYYAGRDVTPPGILAVFYEEGAELGNGGCVRTNTAAGLGRVSTVGPREFSRLGEPSLTEVV